MTAPTFSLVTVTISLVQIRNPDRKPVRAVLLAKLFGVGQHDKLPPARSSVYNVYT